MCDKKKTSLNVSGIEYPVKVSDEQKFEKQTLTVSVNIFGLEERELLPVYISKDKNEHHVNLLLISCNDMMHYCLIRNLSRLLRSLTKNNGHRYYCNYYCNHCLYGFIRRDLLEDHESHSFKMHHKRSNFQTKIMMYYILKMLRNSLKYIL